MMRAERIFPNSLLYFFAEIDEINLPPFHLTSSSTIGSISTNSSFTADDKAFLVTEQIEFVFDLLFDPFIQRIGEYHTSSDMLFGIFNEGDLSRSCDI